MWQTSSVRERSISIPCWHPSTHDSKRSEDVRARINVLSEIPALWRLHLGKWRDWKSGSKALWLMGPASYANDEYLLYQTLIGTWPFDAVDLR